MKRLILTAVSVILCAALVACGSGTSGASSSAPASEPASAASSANSEPEELVMPVVAGSNAYDITTSLENNGLPEAERSSTSDGYTFTATSPDYSYTINTDKDYALSSAEYYVFAEDNGFLGFCASFPYDAADSQTAMDWVNENLGNDAETTIGDATFTLSNGESGPVLKVSAQGRDDYLLAKLEAAE